MVRRVVLLGDSYGTTSLLPNYKHGSAAYESFPEILVRRLQEQTGASQCVLHNLAVPGRHIATSIEQIDMVASLDPDIVLVGHGGLEALVRFPRALRAAQASIGGSSDPRLAVRVADLVRRPAWWLVSGAFKHSSPTVRAVLAKLGIRPVLANERFEEMLKTLVGALLERTSADILLFVPAFGRARVAPWFEADLVANRGTVEAIAASSERCQIVRLNGEVLWPGHFTKDGVHLSEAGHSAVAEVLIRELIASGWVTWPTTGSARTGVN